VAQKHNTKKKRLQPETQEFWFTVAQSNLGMPERKLI
jgi:hypothetical protein